VQQQGVGVTEKHIHACVSCAGSCCWLLLSGYFSVGMPATALTLPTANARGQQQCCCSSDVLWWLLTWRDVDQHSSRWNRCKEKGLPQGRLCVAAAKLARLLLLLV